MKDGDKAPKPDLRSARAHLEARRAQLEEANARLEEKAGRNLFFAVGSGLIFAAVFLLTLFLAKPLFALLVAALIAVSSLELVVAYRQSGRRVPRVGVLISSLAVVSGAYFYGPQGLLFGFSAGILLLAVWRLIEGFIPAFEAPLKTLTRDLVSGLFTLLYIAFLASIAVLLVQLPRGEFWIFTLVSTVALTDIGAYAAGVTLGKHKMTPRISPNKTWEGFAGALTAGVVAAVLNSVFFLHIPWYTGAILGVMLVLTATIGDLTESLIKRNLGVKDMSSWIPGHGGFLDRLDSLLPSTIPVYGLAVILGVV